MYRALFSTLTLILSIVIFAPMSANAANEFPQGIVTLTFDDGWKSIFTNAKPILDEKNLKSTQYIYTDPVILNPNNYAVDTYMTTQNVKDMEAAGHDIGAHSKTHVDLTTLSEPQLSAEIGGSRDDLISSGVISVSTYAYPYGAYCAPDEVVCTTDVRPNVIAAGFLGARGVFDGYNSTTALTDSNEKYALKIQHVTDTTSTSTIQGWIDTAVANKTWLILMFHEVVDIFPTDCKGTGASGTETEECTTTAVLQSAVDYLATNNVCVQTMSQVLTNTPCGSVVPPTNHAPTVANAIPDQDAIEDEPFSFSFAANTFSDEDGDTLSYSAPTLPSWL